MSRPRMKPTEMGLSFLDEPAERIAIVILQTHLSDEEIIAQHNDQDSCYWDEVATARRVLQEIAEMGGSVGPQSGSQPPGAMPLVDATKSVHFDGRPSPPGAVEVEEARPVLSAAAPPTTFASVIRQ